MVVGYLEMLIVWKLEIVIMEHGNYYIMNRVYVSEKSPITNGMSFKSNNYVFVASLE